MIVCICQSVSDRAIRAVLHNGGTSFEQLQRELGVATGCGKCTEAVCALMAQRHPLDQTLVPTPQNRFSMDMDQRI